MPSRWSSLFTFTEEVSQWLRLTKARIETAIETMSKQFEGYHETQIGIFERLDAHRAVQDEVLKRLDKQITQNTERIRQNEIVIGNIDKRLVRLETTVERIDNTVKELRIYVDNRFDKVDARFDAMGVRMDNRFDALPRACTGLQALLLLS